MPASPNRQRLFFALWPHADVRAAIAAMRDDYVASGRPVATDNLHLTLLFLGDAAAARGRAWKRSPMTLTPPRSRWL